MKKLCSILIILCMGAFAIAADSLLVEGKVLLDGLGRSGVTINGYKTDTEGGFSFKIPSNTDSLLTPSYKEFLFDPPHIHDRSNGYSCRFDLIHRISSGKENDHNFRSIQRRTCG